MTRREREAAQRRAIYARLVQRDADLRAGRLREHLANIVSLSIDFGRKWPFGEELELRGNDE